ncbi:hypothetical protein BUALT_Bualt01G0205500 [Buddleja alternifolia]|uniref:Secreted protein n=1 Tax=Buddleja alternifolia TaxID=168488 RepID=A0AAV6YGH0_9LAMI|nr:hypothetical protein BUALT_Bualt01G0205500 [Buddleja alternifolia]
MIPVLLILLGIATPRPRFDTGFAVMDWIFLSHLGTEEEEGLGLTGNWRTRLDLLGWVFPQTDSTKEDDNKRKARPITYKCTF